MSEEEILKDDPLKKPKKITVAMVVSGMALLMVCAFASFHWICADYFNYKANESDAHKQLEEMRTRYDEEESAAKQRLSDVEQKAKDSEAEAVKRAKESEAEAQRRIQAAEAESRDRLAVIEKEFTEKRAEKLAEHKRYSDELDETLKKKKADIAVLLRGFAERFDAKTNDFELAIARKNVELLDIKRMISVLPDVKGQLLSASNALVAARAQRDAVLKEERTVQESYGKWSAKLEAAKVQLNELNVRKDAINKELAALAHTTNEVGLTMVSLQGQIKTLQTKIVAARTELQTAQGDVENAKAKVEGVRGQIEAAEKKRNAAENARMEAESALNAVLDKKREAESARDKALVEASQAESHWAKRKPEIEGLIKDMERILEMKTKALKAAEDKKEGDAN